jgi:hypothetical protein
MVAVFASGAQFALESQVEDVVKAAGKKTAASGGVPNIASILQTPTQMQDQGAASFDSAAGDMNRSARRMKQRLGQDKDKK